MKLSREKVIRLSHLIFNQLNQDEEVEFYADPQEIRQQIFKIISDEMQLRFSSMQVDVFALLTEARQRIAALRAAIEAKRDFWLAQSELQTAVNGGGSGGGGGDGSKTSATTAQAAGGSH